MEALQLDAWDRTAWLCFHIPSFGKERRTFESFHPIRSGKRKADVAATAEWMEEVRKDLPKSLTPEEAEARWRKFCDGR